MQGEGNGADCYRIGINPKSSGDVFVKENTFQVWCRLSLQGQVVQMAHNRKSHLSWVPATSLSLREKDFMSSTQLLYLHVYV